MKQTHVTYGSITALAVIITTVVLYVTNLVFKPGFQYLGYVPFIAGIMLNAIAFSKANDGYVTFGNVFGSGIKASLIITTVGIVWGFISLAVFPDMMEKGMDMARESMEKKGVSDEQIEMGMDMTRKYFKLFMVGGILVGYMFFGAIFSLLGAAIAQKKGPSNPQAEQ